MTHEYPRGLRGPLLQDVFLGFAWVLFLTMGDVPLRFREALLVAIPVVVAWGALTLNFPARVTIDGEGLAFERYGRTHRFAWADVTRLNVRRFLVRDRVLVIVHPSRGTWRGRYWLLESIEGFDGIVSELTRRAASLSGRSR
jgi:hypothetical protein